MKLKRKSRIGRPVMSVGCAAQLVFSGSGYGFNRWSGHISFTEIWEWNNFYTILSLSFWKLSCIFYETEQNTFVSIDEILDYLLCRTWFYSYHCWWRLWIHKQKVLSILFFGPISAPNLGKKGTSAVHYIISKYSSWQKCHIAKINYLRWINFCCWGS